MRRLRLVVMLTIFALIGATTLAAVGRERPAAQRDRKQPAAQRDAGAMVRIEGGAYPIGADEGPRDVRPAHRVTLAPFLIDRYEVTNAEFARFLNTLDVRGRHAGSANRARLEDLEGRDADRLFASAPAARKLIEIDDEDGRIGILQGRLAAAPGFDRHPVAETTWEGARAYCAWRGARLPTEAEWEAAARGREGRLYPWGDAVPTSARLPYGKPAPVGSYPAGATPQGVHDLAGNLAEWTSTLYRPYPYDAKDGRERADLPGERVTRGGDPYYDSQADQQTAIFRGGSSRDPTAGHRHIGFRCARSA